MEELSKHIDSDDTHFYIKQDKYQLSEAVKPKQKVPQKTNEKPIVQPQEEPKRKPTEEETIAFVKKTIDDVRNQIESGNKSVLQKTLQANQLLPQFSKIYRNEGPEVKRLISDFLKNYNIDIS